MQVDQIIIYPTEDGQKVRLQVVDKEIWMSQKQLSEFFDTSKPNISIHIKNIFEDNELSESAVVKEYLTTGADGKDYQVKYYNLSMILAIGMRVRSMRGIQFRMWANQHLQEFLIKGFVMDDERLKSGSAFGDYFDELLERIRDIRSSEMRFYQKVRDLLSLSSDYDPTDKATQMFFAEIQNKLLYAITGHTAAELICARADATQPNMGLTNWKGVRVRKGDIVTAKNYLTSDELDSLNRLTMIFLESAELRVKSRKDLTLGFWRGNVDSLLEFNDYPVLEGAGIRSKKQMENHTAEQYVLFEAAYKQNMQVMADSKDLEELEALSEDLKKLGGK
ncbi:virulence RhuM family protein [Wohlfahrtiimonas chitiniclastica]|uniref:virulence RhuM family protein n=1 Tax=Wohlfahrtiimonas chitiniclastica TaxID=400946 RepID=UPI000B98F0FD|nr:virulence RhuM family protein [Wohlfahrtiimonas chitiniclastica]OYQ75961.1 hydroxyacid dehydrogenase [Wohlfahrtiimonas chitiniclastica]